MRFIANGAELGIDYRWTAIHPDRLQTYAAELVGLKRDAILAHAPPGAAAVRRETHAVPIVFVMVRLRSKSAS